MAQRAVSLDEDMFCCSICLDLLTEPVTIPCGHNYCLTCISNHWKEQEQRGGYSCPQCREVFLPRPVLGKNTMLADLVEEMKKMEAQDAPLHLYVGPGDMGCDFCSGRKLKATKSCLQCLASYCDLHLQPHYDSPAFQSHKLVLASADIQENICPLHNKMKEIFCRSDQQTICYLCSLEDHRGHDTVSAAAERADRQQELGSTQQNIQQRVQDRETDLKLLQKTLGDIDTSADDAVQDVQQMFNQLLQLLDRSSSDMQQQIRSQQEEEVSRLQELQQKVQQEISELTRRDAELEKLSHTEDHSQFLRRFLSLTSLSPSLNINSQPVNYFKEVAAAVTQLTQRLQDTLNQECTRLSKTRADPSLTPAQPETPQSPQALLSTLGSKESAPAGSLEPKEAKASASLPTPAGSGPVPAPPPRLQSSEPRFLQPSAYANFTSIEPTAPVYMPSVQFKTSHPMFPTPTERTVYPFTPPLGYPSAPSGTVPTAPVYASNGSRTSQPAAHPAPDQSRGPLPGLTKNPFTPPLGYPSAQSSTVPTAPVYASNGSKTSEPAAHPAPDQPAVSTFGRFLQNYSNISSPAHPAQGHSRGPLPGLTKNPFTPPLGHPSANPFKGSPPAQTPAEPRTRAEFLSYACGVTFDPNTANKLLVLSGQNRRATRGKKKQSYPNHPERFRDRFQVLSREVLTGRCYWEVEWHGIVSVAVAYRRMVRAGGTSGFGDNNMSWALYCHNNKYIHDSTSTVLSGPQSSRIGVYLDHQAGVLSFYSVSTTMVLLHQVQTSFSEPLHAGICVGSGSAELLQLL